MKIITILGARPQFVKAGTVSREFQKHENINEIIVHTGQHYDSNMSDIFFSELQIPRPKYFLGIGGKSHGAMTGQMMEKIEEVVLKEKPDWILVYGDTNSTLAGALVSSKLHIKLAHIEAGLRSFNIRMPEEVNRILTDRVSTLLFCPTESAIENLRSEGYEGFSSTILKSGDVMQDGAFFYSQLAKKPEVEINSSFILATVHRAENTDDIERLQSIVDALNLINEEKHVVVPLHPRTRSKLYQQEININFEIIDPVGYLEMVWLLKNCELVITDSGGLQKEAFFFSKPCVTLRDETEWVELVENGYNLLVGSDKDKILEGYKSASRITDFSKDLYGGGKATKKIVNALLEYEKV